MRENKFNFGNTQPPNILIGTDNPSIDEANDSYTVVDLTTTTISDQTAAKARAEAIANITSQTLWVGVKWDSSGITTVNWYLVTNGIWEFSPSYTESKGSGLLTFTGTTTGLSINHGFGDYPDIFQCTKDNIDINNYYRVNGTDGGSRPCGLRATTSSIIIHIDKTEDKYLEIVNKTYLPGTKKFTAIKFL